MSVFSQAIFFFLEEAQGQSSSTSWGTLWGCMNYSHRFCYQMLRSPLSSSFVIPGYMQWRKVFQVNLYTHLTVIRKNWLDCKLCNLLKNILVRLYTVACHGSAGMQSAGQHEKGTMQDPDPGLELGGKLYPVPQPTPDSLLLLDFVYVSFR